MCWGGGRLGQCRSVGREETRAVTGGRLRKLGKWVSPAVMTGVSVTCFRCLAHRELLERGVFPQPVVLPALLHFPRRDQCRHFFLLQDASATGRVPGKPGEHGFHQARAEM